MHYEPIQPEGSPLGPAEMIVAFVVCVILIGWLISILI